MLKKAFGGRVRILIEDESEIRRDEDGKIIKPGEGQPEVAEGELELDSLKHGESTRDTGAVPPADPSKATEEQIGDVEFLPPSDSDEESSSSSDDDTKHAKIETAAESLRNFDALIARHGGGRHHHHHHRNRQQGRLYPSARSNYGTATASNLPLLGRYGPKGEDSSVKTMSAVYTTTTTTTEDDEDAGTLTP